jgi:hypothetical protein
MTRLEQSGITFLGLLFFPASLLEALDALLHLHMTARIFVVELLHLVVTLPRPLLPQQRHPVPHLVPLSASRRTRRPLAPRPLPTLPHLLRVVQLALPLSLALQILLQLRRVHFGGGATLRRRPVLVLPVSGLGAFAAGDAAAGPLAPRAQHAHGVLHLADGLVGAVLLHGLAPRPFCQLLVTNVLALLALVAALLVLDASAAGGGARGPVGPLFGLAAVAVVVVFGDRGVADLLVEALPGKVEAREGLHLGAGGVVEGRARVEVGLDALDGLPGRGGLIGGLQGRDLLVTGVVQIKVNKIYIKRKGSGSSLMAFKLPKPSLVILF